LGQSKARRPADGSADEVATATQCANSDDSFSAATDFLPPTGALSKKSAWLPSIVVELKFNHLRNDRRYGEIRARMKLPFKPDGGQIKSQAELADATAR